MSKILIIGAGVMGSAFTFPCIDNGHKVTVLGSPLENDRIDELSKTFFHKILNCNVSKEINFLKSDQLPQQLKAKHYVKIAQQQHTSTKWRAWLVFCTFFEINCDPPVQHNTQIA